MWDKYIRCFQRVNGGDGARVGALRSGGRRRRSVTLGLVPGIIHAQLATLELPGEAALGTEYLLCLDSVRLGKRQQHKLSASFQHCRSLLGLENETDLHLKRDQPRVRTPPWKKKKKRQAEVPSVGGAAELTFSTDKNIFNTYCF